MTAEHLHRFARLWQESPEPDMWWRDDSAGIAMFRPEIVLQGEQPGQQAALAVRGMVRADGRAAPPPSWRQDEEYRGGTSLLLYDLLDRDAAAVRAMRGQFALALWDGRRRRLMLARDHLGQRSMFMLTEPDYYVFCSEPAPLFRCVEGGCRLDPESAIWYLAFSMCPPGRTLAQGIDRLPAAHILAWEPGCLPQPQRYWTPLMNDAPSEATPETVVAIRRALDDSIARGLVDHGPQGILLSGGVDSSYIATISTAVGAPGLVGLTSAFEARHGMNETNYAAAVAEWLKLEHLVVPLYADEALRLLGDVVLAAAEPCGAWAVLTFFSLLAGSRRRGIDRILSGLGADEIFGGYDHFRGYYARFLRHCRSNPLPPDVDDFGALLLLERQSARRVIYPGVARCFDDRSLRSALAHPYRDWQYAGRLRTFYRECRRLKPEAHPMEMMVAHECQHRIPDLLFMNFEPMARRLGIDMIYPFLDPDLIAMVAGLSVESRYRTRSGRFSLRLKDLGPFKYAMLEVARGRVPDVILNRPRKSFTAPFGGWLFNRRFSETVLTRLLQSSFWDREIVRREWVNHVLERIAPGPNPWVFQLWALITLVAWHDRFVDGREW